MLNHIFLILHIGITLVPWVVAIFFRHPAVLLLCITAEILAMVQWLVIGYCLMNPLENGGSKEPLLIQSVADWLRIPLENFQQGLVLVNAAAPSFLKLSRIAGYLGI
jgi:hypothetical protein